MAYDAGINGAGETVCTAEVFDPKTQTWQSIQNMQEVRRKSMIILLHPQAHTSLVVSTPL